MPSAVSHLAAILPCPSLDSTVNNLGPIVAKCTYMNLRKINTCQKYCSSTLLSSTCLWRFDNKDLMNKMRTKHLLVFGLLWSQMSPSRLCFLTFIYTEIEHSDNDTASKNRRLVFFILITQSLARFWRRCLAAAANPNAPQPSPARPAAALDLLASAGRIKSCFFGTQCETRRAI